MSKDTSIVTVSNVHAYLDTDGTAWLNAEDVARGLGFTQTKNGVEYVRWETVNGYLAEFNFPKKVGKDDFIPENMFYRLVWKSRDGKALEFQAKVADEILPAIRKTGSYSAQIPAQNQLFKFMDKLGSINDPGAQLALIDMFRATIQNTQPNHTNPDTITMEDLFYGYVVPTPVIKKIPKGNGRDGYSITALYQYVYQDFRDAVVRPSSGPSGIHRSECLVKQDRTEDIIQALIEYNTSSSNARS